MSQHLQESLSLAKEALPGWAYAQLKQAANRLHDNAARKERMLKLVCSMLTDEQLDAIPESAKREMAKLWEKSDFDPAEGDVEKAKSIMDSVSVSSLLDMGNLEGPSPIAMLSELDEGRPVVATIDGKPLAVTLGPKILGLVTGYWDGVAQISVLDENGDLVPFGGRVVEGTSIGDILEVDMHSPVATRVRYAFAPSTVSEVIAKGLEKPAPTLVDVTGPETPKAVFLSYAPSTLESARGRAFVGDDRKVFEQEYLKAFGFAADEVAVGFCIPVKSDLPTGKYEDSWGAYLESIKAQYPETPIVAVGKSASKALKGTAAVCIPHPSSMAKKVDSRKLRAKAKALTEFLDKGTTPCQTSTQETSSDDESPTRAEVVSIRKASELKRIVYGVVLDPYEIDAHGDWIPPATVEATAHQYMSESRVVGLQHTEQASAFVVESFIETYPTHSDYLDAMANRPHRVSLRSYGSDVIKSGSWVLGVKLSEMEWELYQTGKLTGFSIGAMTSITEISSEAMPEVEFVRLEEAQNASDINADRHENPRGLGR